MVDISESWKRAVGGNLLAQGLIDNIVFVTTLKFIVQHDLIEKIKKFQSLRLFIKFLFKNSLNFQIHLFTLKKQQIPPFQQVVSSAFQLKFCLQRIFCQQLK